MKHIPMPCNSDVDTIGACQSAFGRKWKFSMQPGHSLDIVVLTVRCDYTMPHEEVEKYLITDQ